MTHNPMRMNVGFNLIAGRKPPNFRDLTDKIFGALRCLGRHGSDHTSTFWDSVCLWCGHRKAVRTYALKQGKCTHCKHRDTTEPQPTEVAS